MKFAVDLGAVAFRGLLAEEELSEISVLLKRLSDAGGEARIDPSPGKGSGDTLGA
jgi:hypothetical protein